MWMKIYKRVVKHDVYKIKYILLIKISQGQGVINLLLLQSISIFVQWEKYIMYIILNRYA